MQSVITAKLICIFVFAYAKCWFSHNAAQTNPGHAATETGWNFEIKVVNRVRAAKMLISRV